VTSKAAKAIADLNPDCECKKALEGVNVNDLIGRTAEIFCKTMTVPQGQDMLSLVRGLELLDELSEARIKGNEKMIKKLEKEFIAIQKKNKFTNIPNKEALNIRLKMIYNDVEKAILNAGGTVDLPAPCKSVMF